MRNVSQIFMSQTYVELWLKWVKLKIQKKIKETRLVEIKFEFGSR